MEGHWLTKVAEYAEARPHRKAVGIYRDDGGTDWINFQQLYRQSLAAAQRLQQAGLKPGDRALLLCSTSMDFVLAFFGCMYSGVVAVPLYPPRSNRKAGRVVAVANDCQPAAVIAPFADGAANISRMLDEVGIEATQIDSAELLGAATDVAAQTHHPAADDLAFLQYTSGSTGTPKGVMVTHRCLTANLISLVDRNSIDRETRGVSWLPLHHDMGLIGGLLSPLFQGGQTLLAPPVAFFSRPALWLELLTAERATHSAAPNFAYEMCVERVSDDQVGTLDLSQVVTLTSGAEPVRYETVTRFTRKFAAAGLPAEAVQPSYGMAEATLGISAIPTSEVSRAVPVSVAQLDMNRTHADPDAPFKPIVSCGPAIPGVTVVVVDPESRKPLPDGQVGEILVQSDSVASGYWGREDATQATFGARVRGLPGTFLRTGDLGFLTDGELFVTGRLKDVIIVAGRNIYPQDIEQTVQEAWEGFRLGHGAAFTVDEHEGNPKLVVVQEVDRNYRRCIEAELDAVALLRDIREVHELDCHELVLVRPNNVPMTSSGKIQRRATRQAYLDGTLAELTRFQGETLADAVSEASAGRVIEDREEIAAIVLATVAHGIGDKPESLSEADVLSDFGLDSMLAAYFAQSLTKKLGRPVEAVWMMDTPTLGALIDRIAGHEMAGEQPSAEEEAVYPSEGDPLAFVEDISDEDARAKFERAG